LQRGLARLLFENFQAAQQRHAGAQQIGHLREEARDHARRDAAAAPGDGRRLLGRSMRTGNRPRESSMVSTSRSLPAVSVPEVRAPVVARAS